MLILGYNLRKRKKGGNSMVDTSEIKAQLKRKGLTQETLAKEIDMDPSTLNKKINNEEGKNLTVKEAYKIAEVLNIPREHLTAIFFAQKLA